MSDLVLDPTFVVPESILEDPIARDHAVRRAIGDGVLKGHGYEFGAGLVPSRFAQVEGLTVIDKRNAEDFTALFGQAPDYPILMFEEAQARPPVDFVTAHQVAEHLPNPIKTLAEWIGLLCDGGAFFISVPSTGNVCERLRDPTPISHIVIDYLMDADGTDYASRQHVQDFIQQWTAISPDYFWFAKQGVQYYAEVALSEQRRVEGHDIHWHTFTLDTFRQVIEAAFYVAGCGLTWGPTHESEQALYVVAYKTAERRRPAFLGDVATRVQARLTTVA